jgi:hypothetical protein
LTGAVNLNARQRDQVLPPVTSFIVLYALLDGAFGAASPFLPAFMEERGIAPELIGILFGAGTAVRLVSAPIAGRIADRTHAFRLTLAVCAVGTALAVMSYLPAASFWLLLLVSLLHAAALAPTTNLADALALVASRRGRPLGFEYGWVRGAGSAAFIVASIIAGSAVAVHGLLKYQQDPYGFIGRYQALGCVGKTVQQTAEEIARILLMEEQTQVATAGAVARQVVHATSFQHAKDLMVLPEIPPNLTATALESIEEAEAKNDQVRDARTLPARINALFVKHGYKRKSDPKLDDETPF